MVDLTQNALLIFIEKMCCKIFYETFGEVRYKGMDLTKLQFYVIVCRHYVNFHMYFQNIVIRQVTGNINNFCIYVVGMLK